MRSSKLLINDVGNLKPNVSTIFDNSSNYVSKTATNKANAPLYYVGSRVNTLGSSFDKTAEVRLRYGQNKMNAVYGKLDSKSSLYPTPKNNVTKGVQHLSLDRNGQYIINNFGVSNNYCNKCKKIRVDKYGSYLKYGQQKMYF